MGYYPNSNTGVLCPFVPSNSSYSVNLGSSAQRTTLQSGGSFYRKSFESPNYVFNLTWILDREQFETFMDWWIDGLEEGMVTARIMCISQGPSPISHIGHIIPGSLNVVEQKGLAYTVTAQFEARPAKRYGT